MTLEQGFLSTLTGPKTHNLDSFKDRQQSKQQEHFVSEKVRDPQAPQTSLPCNFSLVKGMKPGQVEVTMSSQLGVVVPK